MNPGLVAAIASVVVVLVYGLWSWQRIVHRHRTGDPGGGWGGKSPARAAGLDATPDAPVAFGAESAWLALRGDDANAVASTLGVQFARPANWRSGVAAARAEGLFVSPPVDGWVFVTGRDLLLPGAEPAAWVAPLLRRLSRAHHCAMWFLCEPHAERFGWAIGFAGELLRGYAFFGDRGEAWWEGEPTDAERAAGCFVDDPRDQSDDAVKWWPDAAVVARIAAAWSKDPGAFGGGAASERVGIVGVFEIPHAAVHGDSADS